MRPDHQPEPRVYRVRLVETHVYEATLSREMLEMFGIDLDVLDSEGADVAFDVSGPDDATHVLDYLLDDGDGSFLIGVTDRKWTAEPV